jgi:hypothetical protein
VCGQLGVVVDGQGAGPGQVFASRAATGGFGRRQIRGRPASVITSLIPVRFNPMPSAASSAAISSTEYPCARKAMIRLRAASLPGALLGPGRASTKKFLAPARKSATAECSPAGV